MRTTFWKFLTAAGALCSLAVLCAGASEIDDQLTARRRVLKNIGPGLRVIKVGPDGKYYVLASPGLLIFDPQWKQIGAIGGPPPEGVSDKSARADILLGEDCDVDAQGNVFVADRGHNLVTLFSPEGKSLRSISVSGPVSLAALPEGEVAVSTLRDPHLVTVYGANGKIAREFGDPEAISSRDDLNRYLSLGRLNSDPQGHIYYGYTYLPEPLVRRYDRFGYASLDFEFTGLDAYPEAQAARKELEKQEKKPGPPVFRPILTAFGVDRVNGDLWMVLHNTLLHFDKEGNRRSEYQLLTSDGARLDANTILVEEERLLVGADPQGVYEFQRPDRKH